MSGPLTTITKEHGLEMIRRYQNGESVQGLGRLFSYSCDTIVRYLRRNNIHIRGISEARLLSNATCPPYYEPTPEQISETSAEIRSTWDELTRLSRTVTKPIDYQTIEFYSKGTRRCKTVSYD